MTKWTYEAVRQALEQYAPTGDPSDPKERKRQKLVRAATELFVQQGYRKTSVDDVARRAAVSKGTVYLYFSTKGELLLHAIVEEKKRHLGEIRPIFAPETAAVDRLRMWLRAALVMVREMPLLARLMGGDMELLAALEDIPAAAVAGGRAFGVDFLADLVDDAAQPHQLSRAELEDRAQVIAGLSYLSGLLAEEKIRGGLPVHRFAEVLVDMIVDGIRARAGGVE